MTRDAWECSFGLWQVQSRRSTLIGKAILDPHCPVRCYPARSHGSARNSSNGNSGSRSLPCNNRSTSLRFTALALSPSRSSDLRPFVCIHNDATDKGGIGPLRLWRLQLADSSTLLLQRSDHGSGRILSSNTARISHNSLDSRTNRPCARSTSGRRFVLRTAESAQDTILFLR